MRPTRHGVKRGIEKLANESRGRRLATGQDAPSFVLAANCTDSNCPCPTEAQGRAPATDHDGSSTARSYPHAQVDGGLPSGPRMCMFTSKSSRQTHLSVHVCGLLRKVDRDVEAATEVCFCATRTVEQQSRVSESLLMLGRWEKGEATAVSLEG